MASRVNVSVCNSYATWREDWERSTPGGRGGFRKAITDFLASGALHCPRWLAPVATRAMQCFRALPGADTECKNPPFAVLLPTFSVYKPQPTISRVKLRLLGCVELLLHIRPQGIVLPYLASRLYDFGSGQSD